MKSLKTFAALALATALIAFPMMAAAADAGADLYKAKCLSCHGADGAKLAKANLATTKMTDAELEVAIADGGKEKKPMHAFAKKGLTPEQIKALVTYVKTLKK